MIAVGLKFSCSSAGGTLKCWSATGQAPPTLPTFSAPVTGVWSGDEWCVFISRRRHRCAVILLPPAHWPFAKLTPFPSFPAGLVRTAIVLNASGGGLPAWPCRH